MNVPRSAGLRAFLGLLISLLVVSLTACPHPMTPLTTLSRVAATGDIVGQVDFGDHRRVQATINGDVKNGCTVALIQVDNGQVVATTLTDPTGQFTLQFSGFHPVVGKLYYLEAVKGLANGSGAYNAVGGDLARVRTILVWQNNVWTTLSGQGVVSINQTTTALAIYVSLRNAPGFGPALDATQLLNTVQVGATQNGYPDSVLLPASLTSGSHPLMTLNAVERLYDLVADALSKNRDPMRWIALSSADPDHNTVVLPDAPFSISSMVPSSAGGGDTVQLLGNNFGDTPSQNQVWFTDSTGATVSAVVTAVSPDLSLLTLTVPPTAVTGPIYLTLKGKTLPGPNFSLAVRDGHSVVDPSGNVYIVNKSMGALSVTQKIPGSSRLGVKALVTGLDNPSTLTFGKAGYPELYVACGGSTKKIFKIDASSPTPTAVASSSTAPFSNPTGMAYQYVSGDYYIADASTNALYKMAAGSSLGTVAPFTVSNVTLNQPHGLSFGPDGYLYVANTGANNVLKIDVSTGNGTVFLSGLSAPYGVAFDNKGSFFVSNNTGNSVYTMPVTSTPGVLPRVYGSLTAFANLPTPGGMDADSSGYIFVADTNTNGIYRIDQNAETYQVAYGLNYPLSTWVDATGQYVLTAAGRILRVDPSGVLTVYAEGLSSAMGLVRDSKGNFYTFQSNISAITQVHADGSSAPIITGLTYCSYTSSTLITSGLSIRNDKLYIRQSASFDVPSPSYPTQGDVLEFTLVADGSGNYTSATGPTSRLRSPFDSLGCVGRNNTTGSYYFIQGRTATIYKADRSGNSVTITRLRQDARLTKPQDIWVDSSTGNLWVINDDGGTGNLFVYSSSGADVANYSTSVNHPTNLGFDGTRLYVNSNNTAGDIREINLSTGAINRTISGYNQPHGFTFMGGALYVNEWGLGRISQLNSYTTQTTPINSIISLSNRNDIDNNGTQLLTARGGSLSTISFNGASWVEDGLTYRDYAYSIFRFFRQGDGSFTVGLNSPQICNSSDGGYRPFISGVFDQYGQSSYSGLWGDPTGVGTVTGTTYYGAGWENGPGAMLIDVALDGSTAHEYNTQGAFGSNNCTGLVTNGVDTAYYCLANTGIILMDVNGVFSTLNSGGYSSSDRMYGGLSYYNGQLYQAIYNKHWIDQINATTGARKTLLQGLVGPDL